MNLELPSRIFFSGDVKKLSEISDTLIQFNQIQWHFNEVSYFNKASQLHSLICVSIVIELIYCTQFIQRSLIAWKSMIYVY